ncbi:hypothetical protein EB796_009407 [Bugula neritina]|uniref:Uncharacterized protein n=1 Tax=Bugula neritina TaxID=10212 RepID=A0A7J7K2U3_BUGNE|nr:hypothetical protein EB796_009407 [Bugula neritina]
MYCHCNCHTKEDIYGAVNRVLNQVQSFLTSYRDDIGNTFKLLESMKPTEVDLCLQYEMCSQAIASLNSIGDNISALFKLMFNQGKEYDRAIFLKAANTMRRSCPNLASDSSPDITPLLGAVNHLFPIYFKPSTQKSSAPRCQHRKAEAYLPPSPESSVVSSPPSSSSPKVCSNQPPCLRMTSHDLKLLSSS